MRVVASSRWTTKYAFSKQIFQRKFDCKMMNRVGGRIRWIRRWWSRRERRTRLPPVSSTDARV